LEETSKKGPEEESKKRNPKILTKEETLPGDWGWEKEMGGGKLKRPCNKTVGSKKGGVGKGAMCAASKGRTAQHGGNDQG